MEYTISYRLYTGYLFTPLSNKNMFINNNKIGDTKYMWNNEVMLL